MAIELQIFEIWSQFSYTFFFETVSSYLLKNKSDDSGQ